MSGMIPGIIHILGFLILTKTPLSQIVSTNEEIEAPKG